MSLEGELDFDQDLNLDGAFDAEFEEEDYRAIGIVPESPTGAKPGSEQKVLTLAARYAAGLPLWHSNDCYDHGPGSVSSTESDGGSENFFFADVESEEDEEEEQLV